MHSCAHFARRSDLSAVLGLPLTTVDFLARGANQKPRINHMQPGALAETWRMFQQGQQIFIPGTKNKEPRLLWWEYEEAKGKPKTAFSSMELIKLEELAGTTSIANIGAALSRTARGVGEKIREEGLGRRAFSNTMKRLCNILGLDSRTARVKLWTTNSVLRCYRDGKWLHVNYEDYDAMIENYWQAGWDTAGIPKHPGKIRNREETLLTDAERNECFE